MDPITHSLAAWALARAGGNRLAPQATATLVAAANIADLDYFYILGGAHAYLTHHLTWSHSALAALVLGGGVALLFWWLGKASQPLGPLLAAGWMGAASHLLLDWTTSAGTELLWPASDTRYALDWFSFTEPALLFLLLLGLALPALFALIHEEIGARRSPRAPRWGAVVALAALLGLAAATASLHEEAVTQLDSRIYRDRTPLRSSAYPAPLNPYRWQGLVETDTTYEVVPVNLLNRQRPVEAFNTFYKPAASRALDRALATETAGIFLTWARFPHIEIVPAVGGGWHIRLQDLREVARRPGARRFLAWIELTSELEVEREAILWGRPGEESAR
ncbi:MAG: metal-dependent hydrolase [Candidatus Acidiferrales bacterium]